MELFRYRNLALGCCAFLVALFFSYYFNTVIKVATLVLAGVAILVLAIIYTVKRGKKSLNLITHITPSLILVMVAMLISLLVFNNNELEKYCDGESHHVVARVSDVNYQTEYLGYYELDLISIDHHKFNQKVSLTLSSEPLKRGDIIESIGHFSKIKPAVLGFDEASYNLSKGITINIESDNYNLVGNEPSDFLDFFEDANNFLDNRLKKIGNTDTYRMLSALFLGNKKSLSDSVKRDFSRIGLSHVLALSGMHITIIITMLGFALSTLRLPNSIKELLLLATAFLFIGITGFSDSALRAGVMTLIAFTLFFFGNRTSLISALFYSVAIICLIDPYSIFSVSLLLSFFAMLGCIVSSRLIHKVKFLKRMKSKILRFVVNTFISSIFALLFTLPITTVIFGNIAILSPLANIFITPHFSLLIYLSPAFLIVADIPFISDAIGWICIKTNQMATFLGSEASSFDNIVIPISSTLQLSAIAVICIFLFGLLIVKHKYRLHMLLSTMSGVVLLIVSSIILLVQRNNNTYIGGHSNGTNDIVFIEDAGDLTIIDVTKTSQGSYIYAYNVSTYLGYYEIENYIISDYSGKTHICIDNLSNVTIVKNIYVPNPQNEKEEEMLSLINDVAKRKGINIFVKENQLSTENTAITFAPVDYLPRSDLRCVAFSIDHKSTRLTYLGSSVFELCDYFVDESAYLSDIIIFGSYGPKYHVNYNYEAPYLDHCVFFGNSKSFANDSLTHKEVPHSIYPIRFCLTP